VYYKLASVVAKSGLTIFATVDIKPTSLARFYPRDAMLACTSCGPASVLVSVSVTSRCSIRRDEPINLVFSMEAFFDRSYCVF